MLVPNEVTWEGRLCLLWLNTELQPEKNLSAGRNNWCPRGAGFGGTSLSTVGQPAFHQPAGPTLGV